MKRSACPTLALLFLFASAAASPAASPTEVDLSYYLPAGVEHDPAVPAPASVLGFQVGEWHVRPDQLVAYMERLAETSDRVRIQEIGRTHEGRPQVVLTISSPANLARLDELVERHRALSEPGAGGAADEDVAGMPVFVYLGYSIHGNEPSGANASMLVAYHLASARGGEVEDLLDHAVVLLDPVAQPGRARPLRPLGQHVPGRPPGGEPGPPRARGGVAERPHQPLLVRPQPRLAAPPAPGEPQPGAGVPALPAERARRLPRDGHLVDLLLPARRAEPPEPAHPGPQSGADPGDRPVPRRGARRGGQPLLHRRRPSTTSTSARARPTRTSRAASASCSSRRAPAATSRRRGAARGCCPSRSPSATSC